MIDVNMRKRAKDFQRYAEKENKVELCVCVFPLSLQVAAFRSQLIHSPSLWRMTHAWIHPPLRKAFSVAKAASDPIVIAVIGSLVGYCLGCCSSQPSVREIYGIIVEDFSDKLLVTLLAQLFFFACTMVLEYISRSYRWLFMNFLTDCLDAPLVIITRIYKCVSMDLCHRITYAWFLNSKHNLNHTYSYRDLIK